jgi:hypothetical protein
MNRKAYRKLIREGDLIAEVDVEYIYTEDDWSPYLSLEDANKLDNVREALREGDVKRASQMAHVYHLMPSSV